jgi:hypothetical protein
MESLRSFGFLLELVVREYRRDKAMMTMYYRWL